MRRLAGIAAAALLLAATPASALTLIFEFEGIVTQLDRNFGLFGPVGAVQVGDAFTGRFSYEIGPGNPDLQPANPEIGAHLLTSFVVDQAVIDLPLEGVGVLHQPGGATLPPAPPDPGRDWLRVSASHAAYPGGVSLQLRGPFGAAFSDDSLPIALDLADFPDGAFLAGLVASGIAPNPSIVDLGTLTALRLVPEPGTLLLTAAGVAMLSLRRRRRRA